MKCFHMVILAVTATLVACSGGSYRSTSGNKCPDNLVPDPEISGSEKAISMKDSDQGIPAGTYNYNGANFYFFARNGVRILISDVKQDNGSFAAIAGCVSGAKPGNMDGLTAETEGLSQFTIGPDSKTSAAAGKTFSFVHAPKGHLVVTVHSAADVAPDQSPERFYQGKGSIEPKMIFIGKRDYEIRSQGMNAMGTWYLRVQYVRADLKK